MLTRLLQNHVLANLAFILVLVMGYVSYQLMPREQDPTINFNWIQVTTIFPGASSVDVERQVTDQIEDALRNVSDIKFVSSDSRESISSILVRFDEISTRTFEKRVTDLRREIEGISDLLPEEARDPSVVEVTTANAFPTVTVVVSAAADDENLRKQATRIRDDIERLSGVSDVLAQGLSEPELHVRFDPDRLEQYALSPVALADTIAGYYRNLSAGSVDVSQDNWAVRVTGTSADTSYLAALPVITSDGEIPLSGVAEITFSKEPADTLVRFDDRPSVLLAVNKKEGQNILELVERVSAYVDSRADTDQRLGIVTRVVDDQTQVTRDALRIMQTNAGLGLILVLVVTWLFLGGAIAFLTGIAIPFILAGTFWFLGSVDQTLNVLLLLGIVISLGMLVDDAVVVVEAIYYRLQRGHDAMSATLGGLKEVAAPVTTAVLTTMSAFLPLMFLPGILGKFLMVLPMVVITALAVSLVEAYWMLPAHIMAMNLKFNRSSRIHRLRESSLRALRNGYARLLLKLLRHPWFAVLLLLAMFSGAIYTVAAGKIRFDFFASDPVRLFYVNAQMPAGTSLGATMDKVLEMEQVVRSHVEEGESRSIVSYAGQMFTETEPLFGDQYGQILVSLKPKTDELRSVDEMIESMRADVTSIPGIDKASFLRLAGGPPVTRAISVKVRGDTLEAIEDAIDDLRAFMEEDPRFNNITDNNLPGQNTLNMRVNPGAVQRTGVDPVTIARTLRLLVDGEIVSEFRHLGENLKVRLKSDSQLSQIEQLLEYRIPDQSGNLIALNQLVEAEFDRSASSIRHYNFRRAITLEADIDKALTDEVKANDALKAHWETIRSDHPGIDLDFSGILDDITESLDAFLVSFLIGIGLIYIILGTQFRSYFQPFLIILTVPMAFTGVVAGLLISGYPLSLFTVFGIVALAGIAVNAAIVLISTANARRAEGLSVMSAIISASRRRVVPILITSLTTIAGLFSLATGLGGESLIWGPVANSLVWGLVVSAVLTLFFIPLLYRIFMVPWRRRGRDMIPPGHDGDPAIVATGQHPRG